MMSNWPRPLPTVVFLVKILLLAGGGRVGGPDVIPVLRSLPRQGRKQVSPVSRLIPVPRTPLSHRILLSHLCLTRTHEQIGQMQVTRPADIAMGVDMNALDDVSSPPSDTALPSGQFVTISPFSGRFVVSDLNGKETRRVTVSPLPLMLGVINGAVLRDDTIVLAAHTYGDDELVFHIYRPHQRKRTSYPYKKVRCVPHRETTGFTVGAGFAFVYCAGYDDSFHGVLRLSIADGAITQHHPPFCTGWNARRERDTSRLLAKAPSQPGGIHHHTKPS